MSFNVSDLLRQRLESLRLKVVTPDGVGLDREISDSEISSPGLTLAGYTERFTPGRVQVLGETEITYLEALKPKDRRNSIKALLAFQIPCVFITKGQQPPAELLEIAEEAGIPIIISQLSTAEFYRRINPFINEQFAPQTHVHGSLADVYGVGLLFVGRSGIGKSECVLDLIERGHRLVADDVVRIRRHGHDILIGTGLELARHHMEIRGVGIIDIRGLFGVRAIRQQKRVEVVVQLVDWDNEEAYDRTGLNPESTEILAVDTPRVKVPLNPGKNITVVSEVIAMNHLLKYSGVDAAERFSDSQKRAMLPMTEYLEEDYE